MISHDIPMTQENIPSKMINPPAISREILPKEEDSYLMLSHQKKDDPENKDIESIIPNIEKPKTTLLALMGIHGFSKSKKDRFKSNIPIGYPIPRDEIKEDKETNPKKVTETKMIDINDSDVFLSTLRERGLVLTSRYLDYNLEGVVEKLYLITKENDAKLETPEYRNLWSNIILELERYKEFDLAEKALYSNSILIRSSRQKAIEDIIGNLVFGFTSALSMGYAKAGYFWESKCKKYFAERDMANLRKALGLPPKKSEARNL